MKLFKAIRERMSVDTYNSIRAGSWEHKDYVKDSDMLGKDYAKMKTKSYFDNHEFKDIHEWLEYQIKQKESNND